MDELELMLTHDDFSDLLEITGRIHAKGEDLDRLASLRRKLQRAIREGLVGELVKPLVPPKVEDGAAKILERGAELAEERGHVASAEAMRELAEQARDSAPAPVTG